MLVLTLLLVACDDGAAPEVRFISPASGQTGVPTDLPLRVVTGEPMLPATWELSDPVRVVDQDEGRHSLDAAQPGIGGEFAADAGRLSGGEDQRRGHRRPQTRVSMKALRRRSRR